MNLTEKQARKKLCPMMSGNTSASGMVQCVGSHCFLWQFDEPLHDGPDSYVSEPGPTGHCGLIPGDKA